LAKPDDGRLECSRSTLCGRISRLTRSRAHTSESWCELFVATRGEYQVPRSLGRIYIVHAVTIRSGMRDGAPNPSLRKHKTRKCSTV
jgi:hypothetical protein